MKPTFYTKGFEIGSSVIKQYKHELVYAFYDDEPKIQEFLDFHANNFKDATSVQIAESLKKQLNLYKEVQKLNLETNEEKVPYLQGVKDIPKPEPDIEEVNIEAEIEIDKPKVGAKQIIAYFKKNRSLRKHLKQVCEEKFKSERNDLAHLGRFGVNR